MSKQVFPKGLEIKGKSQDDIIYVSEEFSLWRDKFQWILYRFPNGRLKENGELKNLPSGMSPNKTYHPHLEQLVDYLVECQIKEATDLEDIHVVVQQIKDDILWHMKMVTKPWGKTPAETAYKAPADDAD